MMNEQSPDLEKDLTVKFEKFGDGVVLTTFGDYENVDGKLILDTGQMWMLMDWWTEGHCMCSKEVPKGVTICAECLNDALTRRWGVVGTRKSLVGLLEAELKSEMGRYHVQRVQIEHLQAKLPQLRNIIKIMSDE
jgi:hypothetical protein